MFEMPPAITHGEIQPQCVQMVSNAYGHAPELLVGILKAEAGRLGMKNQNRNKSYDYGVAQINSAWLPDLVTIGFGERELMFDACRNLWAAGWILQRCVKRHSGNTWRAVGCYHGGEYASKPEQFARMNAYSMRVQTYLAKNSVGIKQWLAGHYKPSVQSTYTQRNGIIPVAKGVSMTVVDSGSGQ